MGFGLGFGLGLGGSRKKIWVPTKIWVLTKIWSQTLAVGGGGGVDYHYTNAHYGPIPQVFPTGPSVAIRAIMGVNNGQLRLQMAL